MNTASEEFDDLQSLAGRLIADRYRLTRFISAGGFGAVYEANDEKFVGKRVAVKICMAISSERAFLREAQLLGQLNHDNIVRVTDQGVHKGLPYIVMELLTGESLESLLQRYGGRLPNNLVVRFLRDIGRALSHAHKHHLVHRDLKPPNVLMVDTGDGEDATRAILKFVLLDFGIASKINANNSMANKTFAGAGTPEYMAPEQVHSQEPSDQTDIYSFGVLLFQMLTGKPPFPLEGDSYADIARVMTAIVDAQPPKPSEVAPDAGIPAEIDELILECLRKSPRERPASISEVRRRFLAVYEPDRDTRSSAMTIIPGIGGSSARHDTAQATSPTQRPASRTNVPAPFVVPLALVLSVIFTLVGAVAAVLFLPGIFSGPSGPNTLEMAISEPSIQVTAGETGLFLLKIARPGTSEPVELAATRLPQGVNLVDLPKQSAEEAVTVKLAVDLNAPPGTGEVVLEGRIPAEPNPMLANASMGLTILPPNVWLPASENVTFTGDGLIREVGGGRNLYEKIRCEFGSRYAPIDFLLVDSKSEEPRIPPFYMMKTKVSQQLFRQFLNERGDPGRWLTWSESPDATGLMESPDWPAFGVTVMEAFAFAQWISEKHGRLPSLRQWWTAAGYYDRKPPFSKGPFRREDGHIFLAEPGPVGAAEDDVSIFGCRDMAGNGQEWTSNPLSGSFPVSPSDYVYIVGTELGIDIPVNFNGNGNTDLGVNQTDGHRTPSASSQAEYRGGIGFRVVIVPP